MNTLTTPQKKAWKKRKETKRRIEIGESVWAHRKELMIKAKDQLEEWREEAEKGVCVVCGDGKIVRSILQTHHLTPGKPSEGTVWLCGSCHNIFNKAKKATTYEDVMRDLNFRHMNLGYNVK